MPLSSQLHNSHSFLDNPFHSTHIKSSSSCYLWLYSSSLFVWCRKAALPQKCQCCLSSASFFTLAHHAKPRQRTWENTYLAAANKQPTNSFFSWGTGAGPAPSQCFSSIGSKDDLFFPGMGLSEAGFLWKGLLAGELMIAVYKGIQHLPSMCCIY